MNYKLLILGILLGVVLSGLIYWISTISNKKSDPNNTSSTVGATKNYLLDGPITIPISRFKLKNFQANRFCIELWLFVNPNAVTKDTLNIFTIKKNNSEKPTISLDINNKTELILTLRQVATNTSREYKITSSFFLQKWEQVIISIDQYLVDLYLDGKIMSSTISSNKITIPDDKSIIAFNSVDTYSDIFVSGLNIKTTAMDPKTALKNYNTGKTKVNGSTQVSLALTKNGNLSKNFILF